MSITRKGQVIQTGNTLTIRVSDYGSTIYPVVRQIVGGTRTGLHATPNVSDIVGVVFEDQYKPLGTIGTTDTPDQLGAQSAGQTTIYGANGAQIDMSALGGITLKNASGQTCTYYGTTATTASAGTATLPSAPAGFLVLSLNGTTTIKVPYYLA